LMRLNSLASSNLKSLPDSGRLKSF